MIITSFVDVLRPLVESSKKVAKQLRIQIKEVRRSADVLAGVPNVPHEPLIAALKELRSVTIAMDAIADEADDVALHVNGLENDFGARLEAVAEEQERITLDDTIEEVMVERDKLAEVVREHADRRLHLASIKEAEGGEEMYVKVSRMMAAELQQILDEAGVTPRGK